MSAPRSFFCIASESACLSVKPNERRKKNQGRWGEETDMRGYSRAHMIRKINMTHAHCKQHSTHNYDRSGRKVKLETKSNSAEVSGKVVVQRLSQSHSRVRFRSLPRTLVLWVCGLEGSGDWLRKSRCTNRRHSLLSTLQLRRR